MYRCNIFYIAVPVRTIDLYIILNIDKWFAHCAVDRCNTTLDKTSL